MARRNEIILREMSCKTKEGDESPIPLTIGLALLARCYPPFYP